VGGAGREVEKLRGLGDMIRFFLSMVVPLSIGAAGAWAVCLYGKKAGLMDMPGERSSHSTPTPRGGGVGIWAVAALWAVLALRAPLLAVLVFLIGTLGLVEDIYSLSPKKRLMGQFVLGLAAVLAFSGVSGISVPVFAVWVFWLLFVVWTTNLYNFMDGIDGIAGITAIVGFILLGYGAHVFTGNRSAMVMCFAIAAASAGFLFFNFPKARVFMGDVGSVTLGFLFAVFVMALSRGVVDFLCFGAFLFTFYADEIVTMTLRVRRGENLLKAHRSHFYQILANEMGIAHWKVSVGYGLAQLAVGISVLFLARFGVIIVLPVLLVYFGVFVLLNWFVRKRIVG
jgi:UDP-N-acetylmuramyl pentapeptide phosphotransferase/UDP-N-acetylglucosamine-1-phosphate transferase